MIHRVKESAKKFKQEVKKTVGASLVGAFGLITAFAWKEVVDTYLATVLSEGQSKFLTAIIITVISVAAIMIITKITVDSENPEKKDENKKS